MLRVWICAKVAGQVGIGVWLGWVEFQWLAVCPKSPSGFWWHRLCRWAGLSDQVGSKTEAIGPEGQLFSYADRVNPED